MDVKRRSIEVLHEPGPEGYGAVTTLTGSEPFTPLFPAGAPLVRIGYPAEDERERGERG